MMEASAIGIAGAFAAGLVSFVSPCVLPLVPGYVSFIAGQSLAVQSERDAASRAAALGLSTVFVLGFAAVFIALGASATALGSLLLRYRYEANLIGGAIVILFGLLMLGLAQFLPWFERDVRFHPNLRGGRPVAAFVLGVAFGFGWTPCIGPVLGAILTVSAVQSSAGVGLLGIYAAGLGVPFLLAALFTREMLGAMKRLRSAGRWLQRGAGLVVVAMGIAMMTGQLSALSYWMLHTFPVFGRIG